MKKNNDETILESPKTRIFIRLEKSQKDEWKKLCSKRNISITSLIINSVNDRMLDDERREVLMFIEKQDNVFAKIENNINQIAKHVNVQKFISASDIKLFNDKLDLITDLKNQQNKIFEKIYKLIGNDH
ncbi:hypothetical protein CMV00_01985 [Elizabethkingia anophelis]|nr:hypothetical protein [Elizabethkingia anophelis]